MTDLETLQAENLRLWNENEQLQDANELLAEINVTMKARVVALELALEFYADDKSWRFVKHRDKEGTYSIFEGDGRERAREVLGRVKGE